MTRVVRVAAILGVIVLTSPAVAQSGNQGASQLAASIQTDLDTVGFEEVDAQSLSLRQLGAIRSVFSSIGAGMKAVDVQFRVQAILDSDGYRTFDGVRVEGTRVGDF